MSVFEWPVRVYYEDTDAGGVVYYANYLKYLERARTEWLRHLGFGQDTLMRDAGIVFAVRRVEIDYLLPARFDDALLVELEIEEIGRASLTVRTAHRAHAGHRAQPGDREGGLPGRSNRFRPIAIPDNIREKLKNAQ